MASPTANPVWPTLWPFMMVSVHQWAREEPLLSSIWASGRPLTQYPTNILLSKFKRCGFGGWIVQWMKNCLQDWVQRVVVSSPCLDGDQWQAVSPRGEARLLIFLLLTGLCLASVSKCVQLCKFAITWVGTVLFPLHATISIQTALVAHQCLVVAEQWLGTQGYPEPLSELKSLSWWLRAGSGLHVGRAGPHAGCRLDMLDIGGEAEARRSQLSAIRNMPCAQRWELCSDAECGKSKDGNTNSAQDENLRIRLGKSGFRAFCFHVQHVRPFHLSITLAIIAMWVTAVSIQTCLSLQCPYCDLNLYSTVYSYNKIDFHFLF